MRLALPVRAGLLGTATGARSTAGLAGLAVTTARLPDAAQPLATVSSAKAKQLVGLLVLGELIADKLPSTPSRLQPPGVVLRVLFGGLSGLLLAQRERAPVAAPSAAGAAGALGGTLLTARGREQVLASEVPDLPAALVEDSLALGLAYVAAR